MIRSLLILISLCVLKFLQFEDILRTSDIKPFSASGGCPAVEIAYHLNLKPSFRKSCVHWGLKC